MFRLALPLLYFVASLGFFAYSFNGNSIEPYQLVGMVITIIAFILWITARIQLGNAFSLVPKATQLITTGIYSKLRHPVYYFSILVVLGLTVFTWNGYLLLALVVLVAVEAARIRSEEKLLDQSFGAKYAKYKETTWF